LYNENDEVVLLRQALSKLNSELRGINYYIKKAYNRRTYHGTMEDVNQIRLYARDATLIVDSVTKHNFINHKNKEILLEQYRKHLNEVYPS
jgi:hypothetical protein